jgi:NAD(P)-dependent dehydrogenase (short-subunit alcohol dehydrogenase family)
VPQVAVVTGGSSGIGAAVARALRGRGWECVLLARGEERLRAAAEELGAEWEVCDVGDREGVERIAAAVVERHLRISLLVNSAGIPGRGGFLDVTPERIEEVTGTNYLGGVWCLRAFLPALEAAAPSDVVNIVSVAGTVAAGAAGPYTASKHAQLAFSRSVARELRPRGVRVHTILPGFVETEGFPQRKRFGRAMGAVVVEPSPSWSPSACSRPSSATGARSSSRAGTASPRWPRRSRRGSWPGLRRVASGPRATSVMRAGD